MYNSIFYTLWGTLSPVGMCNGLPNTGSWYCLDSLIFFIPMGGQLKITRTSLQMIPWFLAGFHCNYKNFTGTLFWQSFKLIEQYKDWKNKFIYYSFICVKYLLYNTNWDFKSHIKKIYISTLLQIRKESVWFELSI